jgi:hypothetical protein
MVDAEMVDAEMVDAEDRVRVERGDADRTCWTTIIDAEMGGVDAEDPNSAAGTISTNARRTIVSGPRARRSLAASMAPTTA